MVNIILDTNFLMAQFQFNIEIFDEIERIMTQPYEVFIVEDTLTELDYIIENQRGKNKENAKLAKKFILLKKIPFFDTEKQKDLYITNNSKSDKVDDILVGIASKNNWIATQDMELKRRIKQKRDTKIIYLRSKNHLEIN